MATETALNDATGADGVTEGSETTIAEEDDSRLLGGSTEAIGAGVAVGSCAVGEMRDGMACAI